MINVELLINISKNLKKQMEKQNDKIDVFFEKEKEGIDSLMLYVKNLYEKIDAKATELTDIDMNNLYTLCRIYCCKESVRDKPAILYRNRVAKKMILEIKNKRNMQETLQKLYT